MVNYHRPLEGLDSQGFSPEPVGLDNRLNVNIQVRDGQVQAFQLSIDEPTPEPESCTVFRGTNPPPLDSAVETTITKLWESTYPDKTQLPSDCRMWEILIPPNAFYSLTDDVLSSLAATVPPAIRLFFSTHSLKHNTATTTPRIAVLPRAGAKSMTAYEQRVLLDYWFCVLYWANTALACQGAPASPLDEFVETYFWRVVERGGACGRRGGFWGILCFVLESLAAGGQKGL